MEIIADGLGKIYHYNKIIKEFSFHFQADRCYGISGPNGSGKSTLIKLLSGFLSPSYGKISYLKNTQQIKRDLVYRHIAIAAAYAIPFTDMNLNENFSIVHKFKGTRGMNYGQYLKTLEWKDPKEKFLSQFSSGMLQRVNVSLALVSDADVVFLDEPTSYLDEQSKIWFYNLLNHYRKNKLIIIASNDEDDFQFCEQVIRVG